MLLVQVHLLNMTIIGRKTGEIQNIRSLTVMKYRELMRIRILIIKVSRINILLHKMVRILLRKAAQKPIHNMTSHRGLSVMYIHHTTKQIITMKPQ